MLTEVRNERGESCRGSGGEDRRRGRYGLVEEAKQRVPGVPGFTDRCAGFLRRCYRGQCGLWFAGG